MQRNNQGARSAQRDGPLLRAGPPERSSRAVSVHTAPTSRAVHSAVVAACSMSPGIAAKRVRCQFSHAQRRVRASGTQKAGSEPNRLQPTQAHAAGPASRWREAAAAAGGTGLWLSRRVLAQAATITSSTDGTVSTTDTMAPTDELWLASHRLCRPTLSVSMPRRSAAA